MHEYPEIDEQFMADLEARFNKWIVILLSTALGIELTLLRWFS